MNYTTVYEFSPKGLRPDFYGFVLVPLIVCGLLFYFYRYLPNGKKIRVAVIVLFALLETFNAYATWSEMSADSSCSAAFKSGRYSIVEGTVENFRPMPYDGHAYEEFHVGSVRFSYSDYEVRPGFNQSASHGSPIREGLSVRISYSDDCSEWPRTILKLEVQPGLH